MQTSKNIAWLSGLVEGEGSFQRSNGSPRITLQMTDLDVIQKASSMFGVPMHRYVRQPKGKATYKPVFGVSVHGMRAIGWMMTLYPLLGHRRRQQVRAVLEGWKASRANLHASRGTRMSATCHPDRVVAGHGLCDQCYMRQWRAARKAQKAVA